MRIRLSLGVVGCACALGLLPALAADDGTKGAADGAAASGVTQSGQGLVPVESGKPELTLTPKLQQMVVDVVTGLDTHQPTPKEFKPAVGADVPRAVYIHAMPKPLFEAMPALKEYMYAHLDRNIVIVNAQKLKAAAVIPLPEDLRADAQKHSAHEAAVNTVGGMAEFSDEQLRAIYQSVAGTGQASQAAAAPAEAAGSAQTTGSAPAAAAPAQNAPAGGQAVPDGPALAAGSEIPAEITLTPLPPNIGTEVPKVAGLSYARLDDGRLILADPQTRKVVGVIAQMEGTTATAGVENSGTRDPIRHLEESGNASAYTGPHSIR